MIKLDLYRLLPQFDPIDPYEEADVDCRYTPYKIFVLETRLYPLIYKMFPELNLFITPKSVYNSEKNRMDVYLWITYEEEVIKLSQEEKKKIQNKIDEITSINIDYSLIDAEELWSSLPKKYPFPWFLSVLEYMDIGEEYNPFMTKEGIYLLFNPNSEYKQDYYNISNFIQNKVEEYYTKGAIVLNFESEKRQNLIQKWGLINITVNLYIPTWSDKRLAPNIVDFLMRKLQEDNTVIFELPQNLVHRHGIIQRVSENNSCMVQGNYLQVQVDDLVQAQKIASVIDASKTRGRVLVLPASRMSEIYLYFEYAQKFQRGDCINYYINDGTHIFSCLLKENDYSSLENLQEKFKNYALDRLIEVSKITKFKNMSPHAIIEEENA